MPSSVFTRPGQATTCLVLAGMLAHLIGLTYIAKQESPGPLGAVAAGLPGAAGGLMTVAGCLLAARLLVFQTAAVLALIAEQS